MGVTNIAEPIYQGEGKWFAFTIVDENGSPINLVGCTTVFQVRQSASDPDPLFTAVDYDVTGAAQGIIKANLPATQTLLMAEGSYFGQLLVVIVANTDVDISDMVKFKIKKPVVEAA